MEVRLIDDLNEFARLRPDWERAYEADPHASVFTSWAWLRGWFEVTPYPWSVLAVRPRAGEEWVGFLPISVRGNTKSYRLDQIREIHMGGDPGADYTGFVCLPSAEPAVITALADYVGQSLPWDRIRLKEVNDPRIDRFLQHLPRKNATIHEGAGTCCPYIRLPQSWDEYLQKHLTYESRKSLRKKLRAAQEQCRITHLNRENRDGQVDALIHLAGLRKHDTPNENLPRCASLFRHCADAGSASIVILWNAETPIAGMGSFIDRKANSLNFYLTGFDDRFANLSPGRVVNALCIQRAIDQKMAVLDFLRGDEPYKFQFGAESRYTRNVTVSRRGLIATTRVVLNRMRNRLGI